MQEQITENEKYERLKEFYLSIKECALCSLSSTRTKFVFGSGSASAEVVFVGEAPGKNEDLQGKPFVGQAGKLLDSLLSSIGFNRNDVFIANVLKCRPPANRDPNLNEINICKNYLFRQLDIINPKIICTMGRHSTQLLLNTSTGINMLRGRVFKGQGGRIIIPINHPAAALYTPSRLQLLKEDFNRLRSILDNIENIYSADNGIFIETPLKENEGEKIKTSSMKTMEQNGDLASHSNNIIAEDQKNSIQPFKNSTENSRPQDVKNKSNDEDNLQLGLF